MIKRRTRPQTRPRQLSQEIEQDLRKDDEPAEDDEKIDLADLIELRKLRRGREGIDISKLEKGDVKKKKKAVEEVDAGGLRPGSGAAGPSADPDEEDEEDKDAKARRVVRTNNFTQQTNVLDVDKHMMAYIEENMRLRKGGQDDGNKDAGPADPYAELFKITDRYKLNKEKEQEEGSVTNSMAMLTAIPEVDLGMDTRLKNIAETEKAKRLVAEERKERGKRPADDEEHLASSRFYRPNLKTKSDTEILREAKLEAMGLLPDEKERRPHHDRPQMATDEMVMERFKKRMRK